MKEDWPVWVQRVQIPLPFRVWGSYKTHRGGRQLAYLGETKEKKKLTVTKQRAKIIQNNLVAGWWRLWFAGISDLPGSCRRYAISGGGSL